MTTSPRWNEAFAQQAAEEMQARRLHHGKIIITIELQVSNDAIKGYNITEMKPQYSYREA